MRISYNAKFVCFDREKESVALLKPPKRQIVTKRLYVNRTRTTIGRRLEERPLIGGSALSTRKRKMCVCRVAFSNYWEHLSIVGVKNFQNGNDRRCMKKGLSDALGTTHEGDPLAHFPACPLNCQVSV